MMDLSFYQFKVNNNNNNNNLHQILRYLKYDKETPK